MRGCVCVEEIHDCVCVNEGIELRRSIHEEGKVMLRHVKYSEEAGRYTKLL